MAGDGGGSAEGEDEVLEDVELNKIDGGSMTVADLKRMTANSEYGSFTLRTLPVPISLYEVLGVGPGASAEEVAAAHRSRQVWDASRADEGTEYLSERCLAARAEVVEVASMTLANPELQAEYEETVRGGDEFVSLDFEQVPGALLLMLEYGAFRRVAKVGKAALLDERVGKCPPELELDLRLLTSLAVLEKARGKLEEGKAASCCALLDEALGFLEGDKVLGEMPLAPGLQANLVGSLQQIIPARGLEYLSLPLPPSPLATGRGGAAGVAPEDAGGDAKRFEGLACIKDYIVKHVVGTPEGAVTREQAIIFVVEALSHMTASEQIDLYRSLTVKDMADLPEELVLLLGRAYLAEGYATSRPRLVEFAAELLSGLNSLRGSVHPELAACSLLLGFTMEASGHLAPWLTTLSSPDLDPAFSLLDASGARPGGGKADRAGSGSGKTVSPADRNVASLRDPAVISAAATPDLDEFARTQAVLEAWLHRNLLASYRETWEDHNRAFHSMLTYFFHPRSRKEFMDLASDAAPWDGTGKMLMSPLTGLFKLARWIVVAARALPRALWALGWAPLDDIKYRIRGRSRASALRSAKPPNRVNQNITPLREAAEADAAARVATKGESPSASGKGSAALQKTRSKGSAWPIPPWATVCLGIFLVWYAAGLGTGSRVMPGSPVGRFGESGTVRKYEKYESRRVYTSGSGGRLTRGSRKATERGVASDGSLLGGLSNALRTFFGESEVDREDANVPQRVAARHTIAAALVVGVLSQIVDSRFRSRRRSGRRDDSNA